MTFIKTLKIGIVSGALCLLCAVAGAQTPQKTQIGANAYLALSRQFGVNSGSEAANAAGGAAMELKGNIAGVAESGDGFIVLLKMDDGSTTNLVGAGAAPQLSVGTRVRVLLKSRAATTDSGEVNLLAIAAEGEIASEQLSRRPKPAPYSARRKSVPDGYLNKRKAIRPRKVPLTSRSITPTRPAMGGAQEVLDAYKRAIRYFNRRGSEQEVDRIARAVLNYSIEYQVDARLVMAVFAVESNFNPRARSHVGATGLGQLMPGTAAGLGVRDIYNIEENVRGAVLYIRDQLNRYEGKDDWTRLQLALAAYNAGPGAVKKYGGKVPPYRETQAYVRKVSAWFLHFLGEKP
jgi:soluble lytic murein transglycosylase-like protein/outer membrane lipoprotein SlyB